MIMKVLIMILIAMGVLTSLKSQETNLFTYPELDGKIAALWISAETGSMNDIQNDYDAFKISWQYTLDDLRKKDLRHFDIAVFVAEQRAIVKNIESAIERRDFPDVAQQCHVILHNFRDVRTYFTSDLYSLDELLSAFSIYDQLHFAVDDPMLGLYEWQDFKQLFTDFKIQFDRYVVIARPGFENQQSVLFKLAVQRVRECSKEFESALERAQQSDFVAPCDDTRDALMDLVALYEEMPSTL